MKIFQFFTETIKMVPLPEKNAVDKWIQMM